MLLTQKEAQEKELLEKEHKYNSLQEEVDEQRKIIAKLRQKYQQAASELKDIEKEEEHKRMELVDTIREQTKDLDFNQVILKHMLKDNE